MEQDLGFYLGDVIQLERGTAGKPGYNLKIVVVSSVPNERVGKLELRDIELMMEDGWNARKLR